MRIMRKRALQYLSGNGGMSFKNRIMNKRLFFGGAFLLGMVLFTGLATSSYAQSAEEGKSIYQKTCIACHTIGSGRLVGPDLAGISERRPQDWIVAFIKSSQSLIKSGDPDAIEIYEQFSKMMMPDHALNDQEVISVIKYIDELSAPAAAPAQVGSAAPVASGGVTAPPAEVAYTKEEIELGQMLFQGKTRLTNAGPACNSCHDVKNDAVIGGGVLARELTSVFSRLGRVGLRAVIGSSPFPVMQAAYKSAPITKEENRALVAFLQFADKEQFYQNPKDYGVGLFFSGLIGAAVLLVLYSLLWSRRKKESVYAKIYDRQIKSSN